MKEIRRIIQITDFYFKLKSNKPQMKNLAWQIEIKKLGVIFMNLGAFPGYRLLMEVENGKWSIHFIFFIPEELRSEMF